MMKIILEVPYSKPSAEIQHDCGILDMAVEVMAEKVIFTSEVKWRGNRCGEVYS